MPSIRLMLVDDHQLLLDTLSFLFSKEPGLEVIATLNSPANAINLIESTRPDVVLTDIAMEPVSGVDLARTVSALISAPKIIGVSFHAIPAYAKKMFAAGASGYVTKNSSRHELVEAIHEVYRGGRYVCKEIRDNILRVDSAQTDLFNALSKAELDLILYLRKGMSSKDIALLKGLSYKTIEVHRYNMMKKVGATNVADLLNMAMARGL